MFTQTNVYLKEKGKWFGIALQKIIYNMDSYLYQMRKVNKS